LPTSKTNFTPTQQIAANAYKAVPQTV